MASVPSSEQRFENVNTPPIIIAPNVLEPTATPSVPSSEPRVENVHAPPNIIESYSLESMASTLVWSKKFQIVDFLGVKLPYYLFNLHIKIRTIDKRLEVPNLS
jgi:hypothetical protein